MSNKENKVREVELLVNDEHMDMTISAISLITSPAIEKLFVFFNKANEIVTLAKIDEEARCLVSPALIPEKRIDINKSGNTNRFIIIEKIYDCKNKYNHNIKSLQQKQL